MPRDNAVGAPAPVLSRWAERLARLRRTARKARAADKARRRVTKQRLESAEMILADIIDGADVIGEGSIDAGGWSEPSIALLVMLHPYRFRQLCELWAEFEDLEEDDPGEENGDDERDVDGEPSLLGVTGAGIAFAAASTALDGYDTEDCVPLPDMVAKAQANANARRAAGKREDGPETIRNGKGDVVIKRGRWGAGRPMRNGAVGSPITVRGKLVAS